MLKTLVRLFGFDSPPPPPPKRRPTARKPKATPPAPVAPPPAPRVAAAPLPNFALACRTYIRQWGQHGPRPSQERLDAAAYALGRDYASFLTALHLVDGPLTQFLVTDDDVTKPAVDAGMQEKMALACYSELDVWSAAEKIDLRNRTLARQGGRPVPEPLHIPDEVQMALIKRMAEAAARIAKGGAGGKSGGVKPVPPEAMGAPEPAMLDPEGGGRSRVPANKRDEEEDTEETATGKPIDGDRPAPRPEDGEPEAEGGGLSLPRESDRSRPCRTAQSLECQTMQNEVGDKPGMGSRTSSDNAQRLPTVAGLPGDAPRGPQRTQPPLPSKIDLRLTEELRGALRRKAMAEGVTDSAMARRILLRALGLKSDLDNRSGFDVSSEQLLYASKLLANLRAVILDARELQDGQAVGVVRTMEAQHARLVDLINRMER